MEIQGGMQQFSGGLARSCEGLRSGFHEFFAYLELISVAVKSLLYAGWVLKICGSSNSGVA